MLRRSLLALFALYALAVPPSTASDTYTVAVWARVLFDESGAAKEVEVIESGKHPAAFISAVRSRLERARIEPRTLSGSPAEFRTGVMMSFEVSKAGSAGGTVRVLGLQMLPLPVEQRYVGYPDDIAATDGWSGSVTATCIVSTAGNCRQVTVKAVPGIPESARRFARASLELWRFEPQRIGDVAIEGEYTLELSLLTAGNAPEDFRQDKFQRAIRGR